MDTPFISYIPETEDHRDDQVNFGALGSLGLRTAPAPHLEGVLLHSALSLSVLTAPQLLSAFTGPGNLNS